MNYDYAKMKERLKTAKKEKKMTYAQLSTASNVPLGTIYKVLGSETKEPELDTIVKLSQALGITPDFAIYGEEIKDPRKYVNAFVIAQELSRSVYYDDLTDEGKKQYAYFMDYLRKNHLKKEGDHAGEA